jgi:hypothetical protein
MFIESAALLGANLEVVITPKDLTSVAAGAAQTVKLFTAPAKVYSVEFIRAEVLVPFADPDDAANNSTVLAMPGVLTVDGDPAALSMQVNGGSAGLVPLVPGDGTCRVFDVDTELALTVTPGAGKAVHSLTRGAVRLLFRRIDSRDAA